MYNPFTDIRKELLAISNRLLNLSVEVSEREALAVEGFQRTKGKRAKKEKKKIFCRKPGCKLFYFHYADRLRHEKKAHGKSYKATKKK